jgi:hypothetical protein
LFSSVPFSLIQFGLSEHINSENTALSHPVFSGWVAKMVATHWGAILTLANEKPGSKAGQPR